MAFFIWGYYRQWVYISQPKCSHGLTEIKAFVLIFFSVIYFSLHLSPFRSEELYCTDNLFISVSIKVQTEQAQAIKWSVRETSVFRR